MFDFKRKNALSDRILLSVEKPARYIGGEYNCYNKPFDSVDLRAVFCFPDVYEIGTANLGMEIIYEQFNRRDDSLCDRLYSPWVDLDRILREERIPLFAVESQRPVRDFDLLLITLSYEMCYTNVLQVLDLSGIPLHARDRGEEEPIVFGGGACAYNPEPVAEFFDVFYIGEAETQYDRVAETMIACKKAGRSRLETLEALAEIPGLYIPRFYQAEYREDGTLKAFYPVNDHAPARIRKEVCDMNDPELPYPLRPIVPFSRGMMDRATLEVMRGCIRGCRFCQAGMIYRPTRKRNLEFMKKAALEMLRSTGFEEINISSLSTSDYSDFEELMSFLLPYCEEHKINVGVPSLRIDAFSLEVMGRVQEVSKSSLTFAPEAGSQRLRNVINKGLTEEEILSGASEAFRGGWNKVKLYFMLGQPTETAEDVKEIPVLADKIARAYYEAVPKEERKGRCQIQISTSFFVPKPFTPFQWAPMCRPEEFTEKAHLVKDTVREQLNQKSMQYHYHEEDQTELEGLLARGDRRVAAVIERAYRKGCIFDAWSEYMHYDLWLQALQEEGLSLEFYNYRERSTEELLPWDFIDIGVSPAYLRREWERARKGEGTPNCREHCSGCGAACFGKGICHENKN